MKVLITGAGGQLGYDLTRVLSSSHIIIAKTHGQMDVSNADDVTGIVSLEKPDVVIHAAAYTNVDKAEEEVELAYQVNSIGTKNVALASQQIGAKMVYVSTDFVFDGTRKTPYTENDDPNPLNIYGRSKLNGEIFAKMFCERCFIVRSSWMYGKAGTNFVTKVISLAKKHGKLTMVHDQIGSPTYSLDLADFIGKLIESEKYGLYHASNRGYCSRYELAKEILRIQGMTHITITPVGSDEFPVPTDRPKFSALDDLAIRQQRFPKFREWKPALRDFLQNDYPSG